MDLKNFQQTSKTVAMALTIGGLVAAAGSVQAEELAALVYQGNQIFTFDSSSPGTIINSVGVSGLSGGDVLSGLSQYGATLYALGSAGNLYTVNLTTGVATLVNHFGTLNGLFFGVNATAAGVRVVSDADINLLLNSTTGAIISSTPTFTPTTLTIDAISSSGGTLYGVDSDANTLGTLNTAAGTFTTIGSLGYDVSAKNGFSISPVSGIAYFASGVSSSGTDANLYELNLTTGFASLVGLIGPGDGLLVGGLTVVPEPSTIAMSLVGGVGLLMLLRRRKQLHS